MKKIEYHWNPELLYIDWYADHPADTYLSPQQKLQMCEEALLGYKDKDSEAYIVIVKEKDLPDDYELGDY